ncbi:MULTISPECIES: hypothetical protein, partial [unclassified Thioalkalivibrio]|uniref:hypothetical protein n=1 Tax=unclassified Thioalkalivibrio TaxID=2621013 RepID=UPI000571D222
LAGVVTACPLHELQGILHAILFQIDRRQRTNILQRSGALLNMTIEVVFGLIAGLLFDLLVLPAMLVVAHRLSRARTA